eukprot:scaffold301_cov243-Pinguiococcus_pyrenoidosus.AAC.51
MDERGSLSQPCMPRIRFCQRTLCFGSFTVVRLSRAAAHSAATQMASLVAMHRAMRLVAARRAQVRFENLTRALSVCTASVRSGRRSHTLGIFVSAPVASRGAEALFTSRCAVHVDLRVAL